MLFLPIFGAIIKECQKLTHYMRALVDAITTILTTNLDNNLDYSMIVWNWNKVTASCEGNRLLNLVPALVLSLILWDICVSC